MLFVLEGHTYGKCHLCGQTGVKVGVFRVAATRHDKAWLTANICAECLHSKAEEVSRCKS